MTAPATTLPEWDTNSTNSVRPSSAKIADGFALGDRPPASWINWLYQQLGQWTKAFMMAARANWRVRFDTINGAASDLLYIDVDPITSVEYAYVIQSDGDIVRIHQDGHTTDSAIAAGGTPARMYARAANAGYLLTYGDDEKLSEYTLPLSTGPTATSIDISSAISVNGLEGVLHWSDRLSLWIHAVCDWSSGSGGNIRVFTNPSAQPSLGSWTSRYTQSIASGAANKTWPVDIAESDERVVIALAGADPDILVSTNGTAWTAVDLSSDLSYIAGAVWRDADSDFWIIGIDNTGSGIELVPYEQSGGSASVGTSVPLLGSSYTQIQGWDANSGFGPGRVALDAQGGMMITSVSYEHLTNGIGYIRAYYYPPGVSPDDSQAEDAMVANIMPTTITRTDNGVTAANPYIPSPLQGGLVYWSQTGQFVQLIGDSSRLPVLAYTQPLAGTPR